MAMVVRFGYAITVLCVSYPMISQMAYRLNERKCSDLNTLFKYGTISYSDIEMGINFLIATSSSDTR